MPKTSWWELSTGEVESECIDIYEMSEAVIELLVGKEEQIRFVVEKYDAQAVLEVVLTISMKESVSTPAIGFSEKVVKFMADVGGYIDIDTHRGES